MKILVVISTITFLLTSIPVDVQRIINVSRIRHLEIISESGDLKTINITLFHDKMQDRAAGVVEFTRDVHLKQVTFLIYRCSFERSACENFQNWKFEGKVLHQMSIMKNQMWSPLFDNFDPKLSFPQIKKVNSLPNQSSNENNRIKYGVLHFFFATLKIGCQQSIDTSYLPIECWPTFRTAERKTENSMFNSKSIYRHSGGNLDANAVLKFYPEATKYFWKSNVTLIDMDDKTVATLLFEMAFHTFVVRDRRRSRAHSVMKNLRNETKI